MDVLLELAVPLLALPARHHQQVALVDPAQQRVEAVGEGGALEGLRDAEEDSLLREYPLLRPAFGLIDELHGEVVAVVVELERGLVVEQLAALPAQGVQVAEEAALVLLQSTGEVELFGLDLLLELLHEQLHLQLQLHAQVVQPVVELFGQQRPLLEVELYELGLSAADGALVQQLHRLRLRADGSRQPLHSLAERLHGTLMGMLAAPSRVAEAEAAEEGVLLAGQLRADVRRLLLAMQQAGHRTRQERVLVHLII